MIYELDISESVIDKNAKTMKSGKHILAQNKISQDITITKGVIDFQPIDGKVKNKTRVFLEKHLL